MKKIIAFILVVVSVFSVTSIFAYAEDASKNTVTITANEVEFIFDADTSEEYRNKVIAHYFNHSDEDISTCGLTCTLFGHKIQSSVVTTITHKVLSTSPRCLQETYNAETCSRCDYTNATLLDATYIVCC